MTDAKPALSLAAAQPVRTAAEHATQRITPGSWQPPPRFGAGSRIRVDRVLLGLAIVVLTFAGLGVGYRLAVNAPTSSAESNAQPPAALLAETAPPQPQAQATAPAYQAEDEPVVIVLDPPAAPSEPLSRRVENAAPAPRAEVRTSPATSTAVRATRAKPIDQPVARPGIRTSPTANPSPSPAIAAPTSKPMDEPTARTGIRTNPAPSPAVAAPIMKPVDEPVARTGRTADETVTRSARPADEPPQQTARAAVVPPPIQRPVEPPQGRTSVQVENVIRGARTLDELYQQRIAAECGRGLIGQVCREKIRMRLCTGRWSEREVRGLRTCLVPGRPIPPID